MELLCVSCSPPSSSIFDSSSLLLGVLPQVAVQLFDLLGLVLDLLVQRLQLLLNPLVPLALARELTATALLGVQLLSLLFLQSQLTSTLVLLLSHVLVAWLDVFQLLLLLFDRSLQLVQLVLCPVLAVAVPSHLVSQVFQGELQLGLFLGLSLQLGVESGSLLFGTCLLYF